MRHLRLALGLCLALQGPAMAHHQKASECRQIPWEKGAYQTERMVRCYARVIHPPGGPDKSASVADCETNFAGGDNLYQFMPESKFPRLARHWMQGIRGSRSIDNGRANAIVAMKVARDDGTWKLGAGGQWSCG